MDDKKMMWFWLSNLPGIGSRKIACLRENIGDIDKIYGIKAMLGEDNAAQRLRECFTDSRVRYNQADIDVLLSDLRKNSLERKYNRIINDGIKIASIDCKDYPANLKDIFDPPYILYYKGKLPDAGRKSVAIVGSRDCSEYGRSMAKRIAASLAYHDVQIISGFARGIDTAAHNGCMTAGATYAVLGCGLNHCYPPENKFTYDEIIEKGGGILSELLPDEGPRAGSFPMRNRIISGMADLVIVVEAGEKSGALITADHALDQNKTVMALPGRACDRLSVGCNRLIRQGAAIISSMEDIYFELGIQSDSDTYKGAERENKNKISEIKLAKPEKMLYSLLDFTPQGVDDLVEKSGLKAQEVSRSLVGLELYGLATQRGGCYLRC